MGKKYELYLHERSGNYGSWIKRSDYIGVYNTENSKSTWFLRKHKANIEYMEELLGKTMQELDDFCAWVAADKNL